MNSPLCFFLGVCAEGGKVTGSGNKDGDGEGFCTGREVEEGGFWKSVDAAAGNGSGDGNCCCLLSWFAFDDGETAATTEGTSFSCFSAFAACRGCFFCREAFFSSTKGMAKSLGECLPKQDPMMEMKLVMKI